MADQDKAAVADTDYAGAPYRPTAIEEVTDARSQTRDSPYDRQVDLPDGRRAALTAGGQYYVTGDGGWPDWDQPVYIPGLSRGPVRGERIELPGQGAGSSS